VHPYGVDGGGVDDAADAGAVGGLPDHVGRQEVGAEELLEAPLVGDGGEVDDHVGAVHQRLDLIHLGAVGDGPGLVRGDSTGGVLDVHGD
jgi:hypothetical protein